MTGALFSAGEAASILFGCFFVLLVLRVPVAFALGLACLPLFYLEPRLGTMMLAQETFNAYNSFILLAVPFFLLTANLMSVGGITDRLVALSRAIVGSFPGSLAQINVVLSVFFAGISGSSTADAASQSKIFIDAQTREGYDLSFSIAITAVSAVLAVIIPPSIFVDLAEADGLGRCALFSISKRDGFLHFLALLSTHVLDGAHLLIAGFLAVLASGAPIRLAFLGCGLKGRLTLFLFTLGELLEDCG